MFYIWGMGLKGNKYALGNDGGRPPIYDGSKPEDVERLGKLCLDYFQYIKGVTEEDDILGEGTRPPQPPTVTGLALHLGFSSKSTLYDYGKQYMFSDHIKAALTRIEQYHEIAVSMGEKCTGNIFLLKNFGWHDSVKTDITTNGENLNSAPTIVFKKFKDDEQ